MLWNATTPRDNTHYSIAVGIIMLPYLSRRQFSEKAIAKFKLPAQQSLARYIPITIYSRDDMSVRKLRARRCAHHDLPTNVVSVRKIFTTLILFRKQAKFAIE